MASVVAQGHLMASVVAHGHLACSGLQFRCCLEVFLEVSLYLDCLSPGLAGPVQNAGYLLAVFLRRSDSCAYLVQFREEADAWEIDCALFHRVYLNVHQILH